MMNYYLIHILHFKDGKQPLKGKVFSRGHSGNGQTWGPESKPLIRAVTLGRLKSVPLLETALTPQGDQRTFKRVTPAML